MTDKREDDPNLIIEVMDDGTEVVIDIDACNQIADSVIESLFELEESEQVDNFDSTVACFGLFINTLHVLLDCGWSPDELKKEIDDHSIQRRNSMN